MYQLDDVTCSNCKKEFKAVFQDNPEYYFCSSITCKIKVLVELREENPLAYGITENDLKIHYGSNWKNILRQVID